MQYRKVQCLEQAVFVIVPWGTDGAIENKKG
jgi:hypothetical protein